jgi:glycosyltransferase involved in cell wall biosynthesis
MSRPAKLLYLVNTLSVGGAERNVAALCKHMDRSRFQPEVWTLKGGGQFEDQVLRSGTRLRNLGRGWARSPLFAWQTARQISRSDADLIQVFLPSIAAYAALARTFIGVRQPIVLTLGQSHTGQIDRWVFRWCSRTFDWLVANSPSAEKLGHSLGFAPDRMSLIPNGHEIDRYRHNIDRRSVRSSVGVAEDEHMLLCVSRLIDSKRVSDAVAAMEHLGECPRARLVVVGDGPLQSALAEEVSKRGLNGKVTFAGFRKDIPDLLAAADLFLFPSETEGLPNALIEACLAGLPVVACSVRGVVDVVRDGETALLVPPHSPRALAAAVRRLLLHPKEADRLAAAAADRAQKDYSIEQTLSALYDVYDRLLGTRRLCATDEITGLCTSA